MRLVRILTVILIGLLSAPFVPAQAPAGAKKAAPKAEVKSEAKSTENKSGGSASAVDINHATAAELKTLPGIGEAYSAAIIKNRPYKNKTQLRSRNVIPPATYDKIKDQIIAKQ